MVFPTTPIDGQGKLKEETWIREEEEEEEEGGRNMKGKKKKVQSRDISTKCKDSSYSLQVDLKLWASPVRRRGLPPEKSFLNSIRSMNDAQLIFLFSK